MRLKIEHLNALAVAKLPMDTDTAQWLGGIGDDLAAKLAAVKLILPRASCKIGEFLTNYLERRKADSKPATVVTIGLVVNDLTRFFGEKTDLRDVTESRADEFRTHYLTRGLASATVARRLKSCRMLFKHALRMKLVSANPFAEVTSKNVSNEERKHYVTAADTERIVAACNPQWRIIVALARFAGLRCPSEVLSVKWSDVNWDTERMTVPSCKTEHIPGKAYRVVPIFAELRPYLDEAWMLAADGAEYIVPGDYRLSSQKPGGWGNTNLRSTFLKIIRRAGLQPWPRLFHNLRASCETDLMKRFPIHVVCAWIGNTPKIALGHYLQTLDADFKNAVGGAKSGAVAVQNAVQSATGGEGQSDRIRSKV
jgi:integrase